MKIASRMPKFLFRSEASSTKIADANNSQLKKLQLVVIKPTGTSISKKVLEGHQSHQSRIIPFPRRQEVTGDAA